MEPSDVGQKSLTTKNKGDSLLPHAILSGILVAWSGRGVTDIKTGSELVLNAVCHNLKSPRKRVTVEGPSTSRWPFYLSLEGSS